MEQIKLIVSVQNTLAGYYGDATRIGSTIGKKIEGVKVDLKRLRRDLHELAEKKDKNIMDEFLLENGESLVSRGEEGLSTLKNIDYISIIKRSMKKNEICLGRVDENNIRVFERIEIGSIKNISFNLIEEDMCEYLRKLRRKNIEIDLDKFINEYARLSYLSKDSIEYIKILLSIPQDSLKQWYRYRQNKKEQSPEECLKNIRSTMAYEKYLLI